MKALIKEVKILIANDKVQEALNKTMNWVQEGNESDLENDLILLLSRYNMIRNNNKKGVMTFERYSIEKTKISESLVGLLEDHLSFMISMGRAVEEVPTKEKSTQSGQPKQVLFLGANPSKTALLQLEKEFAKISHQLQDSSEDFNFVSTWAVTPSDLLDSILKYKPNLIHFSGHGTGTGDQLDQIYRDVDLMLSEEKESAGGIILEDGQGGMKIVHSDALNYLFSVFTNKIDIQVVILNACYSEKQALAISKHVPYVVGMNRAITDEAAILFSSGFYMGLSRDSDVEHAFQIAKGRIMLENLKEEATPVLIKEGEILNI